MQRRNFIAAALLASLGKSGNLVKAMVNPVPLPQRRYRDDVNLSVVGFGGIILMGMPQREARRAVAEAVGRGVNYFDVAPSYGGGEAEEKLGPALAPYRKGVFLACKTMKRDARGAKAELDRSLRRLKTDRLDLYQFHAVTDLKEVDEIFASGGALEAFVKGREEGKFRYIGFSAHSEEAALAMMDRFPFDSVLFPINLACYGKGNFGPSVIAMAKEKGVARLALKMLARGPWPEGVKKTVPKAWYQPIEDRDEARRAVRFTLSEEITAAIPPGDIRLFNLAMELAAEFVPLAPSEREEMLASTAVMNPLFPLH
jgi:aryl-alcohol dehydrogenase-like predicted oxidoreductase